jgi:hypothetical protein
MGPQRHLIRRAARALVCATVIGAVAAARVAPAAATVLLTGVGTLTLAFGSASPLAIADASGFSNTSPYPILAAPTDPNGAVGDIGIKLVLNYGTIGAGQAVSATRAAQPTTRSVSTAQTVPR